MIRDIILTISENEGNNECNIDPFIVVSFQKIKKENHEHSVQYQSLIIWIWNV